MHKKDLRALYKRKRKEISSSEMKSISVAVNDQLCILLEELQAEHINCFLSSTAKNEINTNPIFNWAWDKKTSISIPISDYDKLSIMAYELRREDQICLDQHQIPQPVEIHDDQFCSIERIEIIIVPLLVGDQKGFRVGYGKGMYDRFIAKAPDSVITIGVSAFEVIARIDDTDQYDQQLNYLITPTRTHQFSC